jgi:hypothetical protein
MRFFISFLNFSPGMGWSGEKEEAKEEEKLVARDARLGLGASARPPDEKQRGSKEDIKKRKEEWDKKACEKLKKQLLNDGDFVWLRDVTNAGKRALVVNTRGVPGLDRIRVRLELSGKSIEIKRTDAVLLSEEDLKAQPYHPADPVNADTVTSQFFGLKKNEEDNKESGGGRKDRSEREGKGTREERSTRERGSESERGRGDGERDRDRNRDRVEGKREHDRYRKNNEYNSEPENSDDNNNGERENSRKDSSSKNKSKDSTKNNSYDDYNSWKSSSDQDRGSNKDSRIAPTCDGNDNSSYDNSDKRSYNNNNSNNNSSSNKNNSSSSNKNNGNSSSNNRSGSSSTWLVTGIRVRVVSKRCPGHLEKGSVVDVPSARVATVRLDGGKVQCESCVVCCVVLCCGVGGRLCAVRVMGGVLCCSVL